MSNVIRVGIAGLGSAARQRLPAFKQIPDARLTAVADVRKEALEVMSGYGYFNSEELTWGIGESGQQGDPRERRRHATGPIAPQVKYGPGLWRKRRAIGWRDRTWDDSRVG